MNEQGKILSIHLDHRSVAPCLVRVAHALLNHVGKVAVLVHVDVLAEGQIQAEDPPALRHMFKCGYIIV